MTGDRVVAEARRWLGTPYHHGASLRGIGCDCLGLVVGVRRACFGVETPVPVYPPDWAEAFRRELLGEACAAQLLPAQAPDDPGTVLLLRWRLGRPASHLAISAGGGAMVHAHAGAGVVETPLTPAWRRRLAGLYRFAET